MCQFDQLVYLYNTERLQLQILHCIYTVYYSYTVNTLNIRYRSTGAVMYYQCIVSV
jgi:hypothetical protein